MSMKANLFVLVSICFVPASEGGWNVAAVDDTYGCVTPALALNGAGVPAIAYYRVDHGAAYAWPDGSAWQTEYIYQPSYGNGGWFDMVFDSGDTPHVSFGGLSTTEAAYALRNGSWGVSFLPEWGEWTSIALDSQGTPCFALLNNDRDNVFVHWNGGGWESQVIEEGNDYDGSISLAVDPENNAHIAYNSTSTSTSVRYAFRTPSGDIALETVDSSMATEPRGISLALFNGMPAVSYNVAGEVRYASCDGASWSVETVYSTDTGAHEYGTSLAFDSYGNPHIAHCSGFDGELLYSVDPGSGWVTENIHPISGGGDPSLALDSNNQPHIAFISTGSALMYAFGSEMGAAEPAGDAPAVAVSANPFTGNLNLSFRAGGSHADLSVYDCAGRRIATLFSGTPAAEVEAVTWNPANSLPAGSYIIALRSGGELLVQRVAYLK